MHIAHLLFVVPNVDVAIVQCSQQPWLCWMEINGLDSVGSIGEFSLLVVRVRVQNEGDSRGDTIEIFKRQSNAGSSYHSFISLP